MTKDDMKRYQFKQPFKPFVIRMTSGFEVKVQHPEFMMHSLHSQSVSVADEERNDYWLIDLRQIESIRSAAGPAKEPPRERREPKEPWQE